MLRAKGLAIELSLGSSKVFSGVLPEWTSDGRWTSLWAKKTQSSHFPPLLCQAIYAELHQCQDVPKQISLSQCSLLFFQLGVLPLFAEPAAMGPAECDCFEGLYSHMSLTSSHQFCNMCIYTFPCFNFPVFAIRGVWNSKPTVSCLLGKLVHLPEKDVM